MAELYYRSTWVLGASTWVVCQCLEPTDVRRVCAIRDVTYCACADVGHGGWHVSLAIIKCRTLFRRWTFSVVISRLPAHG
ncbi:hypothetical protein LXA43DRAFT_1018527 [Ganoderma leucocontextum]|nr:hypothetical protein LXA43DRAFT_1018527 [Ganoderma leucocontextum]